MAEKTGRFAIIEQLLADGITHMFGNPGTVEQGFLDALATYPDMNYVLTLQETIAVMVADGYARATKKPTVVQIHSTPGLGNSIGALYQAMRGHAPLVVLGGDAGVKYLNMDSQMAGDLVAMAEPVTKYATTVYDPNSTLRVLRRAIKIAATPPMGPVYVCLPQDILDYPLTEPIFPTLIPSTRTTPEANSLRAAAEHLANAANPRIYVGDGVAYSHAQDELTRVAEMLGAEVRDADSGELNMSYAHPLYKGATGHMFGANSLPVLQAGDVNLVVGTYIVPEVFPVLGDVWGEGAKVIHIDLNAYEIAKNHRVDIGLVADPKLTLARLAGLLDEVMTDDQKAAAKARLDAATTAADEARALALEADEEDKDAFPMHFSAFAAELAKHLPEDTIIFDEALTNSPPMVRHFPPKLPDHYFLTRGGSLGVGIPGAIGAKIANPDKVVVGLTGDGGGMYTIQALWTAARYDLEIVFIVCNNRSYRLLQLNIMQYWQEIDVEKHDFPIPFDLSKPKLNFAEMARSMGAQGIRIERPDEIAEAVEQALSHKGPFLIDVVLEGDVHPEMIGRRYGQ